MCSKSNLFRLIFVTNKDHPNRSVAFLDSLGERKEALAVFNGLHQRERNYLIVGFEYWRDKIPNNNRHHGWNKSEFQGKYISCYVFKGKEDNRQLRLYGFLCHPKIGDRYELCVLVHFAYKKRHETEEPDLNKVIRMEIDPNVQSIVKENFFGG